MKEVFNICLLMLGWFGVGLIFAFCTALLLASICITVAISRELFDIYIRDLIRRKR